MAIDYRSHSRFFFTDYRRIQDAINAGTINQWDIVLCSDTQEMLLVGENFDLIPIHSKVYRFVSVSDAETQLNTATDSYQGQIVSILDTTSGTYKAYMVNGSAGHYYVTAISIYNASDINYNEIGNRPIEQLYGDIEHPVVLSSLENGFYKVHGAYKVSTKLITIFQSDGNHVIVVNHNEPESEEDTETISIKVITDASITDYIINNTDTVIERNNYATKQWVESQGYITDADFDAKIQALDIMTRENAEAYIQELIREGVENIVTEMFDDQFNERFDTRLNIKMQAEDNSSIQNLFD